MRKSFKDLGFKVGDEVKCVKTGRTELYKTGEIYEIVQDSYELVTSCSRGNGFSADWELVKEEKEMFKFKVGDKVKIIANSNGSRNQVGDIGTITEKSPYDLDLWVVEVPGRKEENPYRGAKTRESEMEKVEDMFEDQWHLNDGKVTIPDDADKLEKDGSVVAFRKRKPTVFNFGDKVKYDDGTIYIFIKNTEYGWCYGIKETSQCCTTLQLGKLTKV